MKNSKYHAYSLIVVACLEMEGWIYYLTSKEEWKNEILCDKEFWAHEWAKIVPQEFIPICLNGFSFDGDHKEAISIWRKRNFAITEHNFNK